MTALVRILEIIWRFSAAFPRLVILVFVLLGIAGFSTMPFIKVGASLMSGLGQGFPNTSLTLEHTELFGDQDALTVLLEFPESPGKERLSIIRDLAKALETLPGVRNIRYRLADPEDENETKRIYSRFLLGMDSQVRQEVADMFSLPGIENSFERTRNRLWLTHDSDQQQKILADPTGLAFCLWRFFYCF